MPPVVATHDTRIHPYTEDIMKRLVITVAGFGTFVLLTAGPVLAFQCPKLVGQINAEAGRRFDNAAYTAKTKAAAATKLHAEGKHAESQKAAEEGLAVLGLKKM
jgi:hypothetical protein